MDKKKRWVSFVIVIISLVLAYFICSDDKVVHSKASSVSTKELLVTESRLTAGISTVLSENIEQASSTVEEAVTIEGYIFIGDSRFVGMNDCCSIDTENNCFVVAKVSQGYDWFSETALHQVESIKVNNPDITSWTLVIGLGINDLYNIDKYVSTYESLKDNYNLVLISVNPIEYHNSITQEDILTFNNKLKSIGNVRYVDTYSYLVSNGFSTQDGVHYSAETYKDIYAFIQSDLK